MSNLFVDSKNLKILTDILSEFCPESQVFAYGSRVNGRAHEGSDLDLTIKNFPKDKYLFELKEILSESDITFLVDVNNYDTLPESFKKEIDVNCIKIFPQTPVVKKM